MFWRDGRRSFLLARANRLRLGANDLRFDDDVVGAADHQEMLDIVAPHENELALSVEREGVDQAEPRLARPARRRKSAGDGQTKRDRGR